MTIQVSAHSWFLVFPLPLSSSSSYLVIDPVTNIQYSLIESSNALGRQVSPNRAEQTLSNLGVLFVPKSKTGPSNQYEFVTSDSN